MKKKMLFVIATIVAFALFVPSVWAATVEVSSDLATAVSSATDGDTLKLTTNLDVSAIVTINKDLTLDLNGNEITLKNHSYLLVEGGKLTVTGEGSIVEEVPYYAPIMVKGSTDVNASNYSVLNVGKDVYLEGWSGVFVRQNTTNTAYGVSIIVNGTIEALADEDDVTGHGVYVNGSIKHTTNAPVITLGETAVINSEGTGIYAAGYAVWNINGATITGVENALAIKSGKVNITGGTLKSTGEDLRPTESYENGVNPSGAAIQIESNKGYAGEIELNITGGTFISENGVAVYEYLALGKENDETDDTTETSVKNIVISGGEFTSYDDNFDLSEKFDEEHTEFITGGTFEDKDIVSKYLSTDEEYVITDDGEVLLKDNSVVLSLNLIVNGEVEDEFDSIIKKGYKFSEDEIKELEEELKILEEDFNEEYKEDGLVFLGLFYDKDGKEKVDFTKELDEDTEWYIIVGEKVENASGEETKEENPKTGDVNLAFLIGTILVGTAGAVIISKKRFAKSN